MKEELRNCPFCGSDAPHLIEGSSMSWVVCTECGADGPMAITTTGAIRKWNGQNIKARTTDDKYI